MFPNSILIRTTETLTIADSNMFRINKTQLKYLSFSKKRQITILGRIETKLGTDDFAFDEENFDITKLLPQVGLVSLQSLDLLKPNDIIVRPIAIYFA